jgi:two-component system, chemotaxis family, chemotaxis protein CheY
MLMALDLERMAVLFVDDSPFIRSLMISALKMLGVGQVITASDGGDAIEKLKLMKSDPIRVGVNSIDMIICNWDMSPVDGPMLLRFVRRHKESSDRFLPFIFLTAYTERERIEEARELGANDVVSKPFAIRTIGEKITQVIHKNRQFVHTKDYFGPDRRRQAMDIEIAERRFFTDKSPEVEVIHG